MNQRKKLLVAGLILATILLAVISVIITLVIGNNNNTLESQTGAQTNILANCNNTTNTCSVSEGVCNPSKVYVHFCDEVKRENEKCISSNPIELPVSPLSKGSSVNLNDYLQGIDCGTAQMYLELNTSGINSLGACGTTVKRFNTSCSEGRLDVQPISFPTNNQINNNIVNSPNSTQDNGGLQIAEPQFVVNTTFSASCENNGDAILRYTINVSNTSTVSGTITKLEEQIASTLISNLIVPSNINNNGTLSGNLITWQESQTARTYTAGQTKSYTYQIRIPKNLLSTFVNGTTSSTTVTYNTSSATGNTNTFVLNSKHSCSIQTINTVNPQTNLPATSIEDDARLLIIGGIFILLAIFSFKFRIGDKIKEKFKLYKR